MLMSASSKSTEQYHWPLSPLAALHARVPIATLLPQQHPPPPARWCGMLSQKQQQQEDKKEEKDGDMDTTTQRRLRHQRSSHYQSHEQRQQRGGGSSCSAEGRTYKQKQQHHQQKQQHHQQQQQGFSPQECHSTADKVTRQHGRYSNAANITQSTESGASIATRAETASAAPPAVSATGNVSGRAAASRTVTAAAVIAARAAALRKAEAAVRQMLDDPEAARPSPEIRRFRCVSWSPALLLLPQAPSGSCGSSNEASTPQPGAACVLATATRDGSVCLWVPPPAPAPLPQTPRLLLDLTAIYLQQQQQQQQSENKCRRQHLTSHPGRSRSCGSHPRKRGQLRENRSSVGALARATPPAESPVRGSNDGNDSSRSGLTSRDSSTSRGSSRRSSSRSRSTAAEAERDQLIRMSDKSSSRKRSGCMNHISRCAPRCQWWYVSDLLGPSAAKEQQQDSDMQSDYSLESSRSSERDCVMHRSSRESSSGGSSSEGVSNGQSSSGRCCNTSSYQEDTNICGENASRCSNVGVACSNHHARTSSRRNSEKNEPKGSNETRSYGIAQTGCNHCCSSSSGLLTCNTCYRRGGRSSSRRTDAALVLAAELTDIEGTGSCTSSSNTSSITSSCSSRSNNICNSMHKKGYPCRRKPQREPQQYKKCAPLGLLHREEESSDVINWRDPLVAFSPNAVSVPLLLQPATRVAAPGIRPQYGFCRHFCRKNVMQQRQQHHCCQGSDKIEAHKKPHEENRVDVEEQRGYCSQQHRLSGQRQQNRVQHHPSNMHLEGSSSIQQDMPKLQGPEKHMQPVLLQKQQTEGHSQPLQQDGQKMSSDQKRKTKRNRWENDNQVTDAEAEAEYEEGENENCSQSSQRQMQPSYGGAADGCVNLMEDGRHAEQAAAAAAARALSVDSASMSSRCGRTHSHKQTQHATRAHDAVGETMMQQKRVVHSTSVLCGCVCAVASGSQVSLFFLFSWRRPVTISGNCTNRRGSSHEASHSLKKQKEQKKKQRRHLPVTSTIDAEEQHDENTARSIRSTSNQTAVEVPPATAEITASAIDGGGGPKGAQTTLGSSSLSEEAGGTSPTVSHSRRQQQQQYQRQQRRSERHSGRMHHRSKQQQAQQHLERQPSSLHRRQIGEDEDESKDATDHLKLQKQPEQAQQHQSKNKDGPQAKMNEGEGQQLPPRRRTRMSLSFLKAALMSDTSRGSSGSEETGYGKKGEALDAPGRNKKRNDVPQGEIATTEKEKDGPSTHATAHSRGCIKNKRSSRANTAYKRKKASSDESVSLAELDKMNDSSTISDASTEEDEEEWHRGTGKKHSFRKKRCSSKAAESGSLTQKKMTSASQGGSGKKQQMQRATSRISSTTRRKKEDKEEEEEEEEEGYHNSSHRSSSSSATITQPPHAKREGLLQLQGPLQEQEQRKRLCGSWTSTFSGKDSYGPFRTGRRRASSSTCRTFHEQQQQQQKGLQNQQQSGLHAPLYAQLLHVFLMPGSYVNPNRHASYGSGNTAEGASHQSKQLKTKEETYLTWKPHSAHHSISDIAVTPLQVQLQKQPLHMMCGCCCPCIDSAQQYEGGTQRRSECHYSLGFSFSCQILAGLCTGALLAFPVRFALRCCCGLPFSSRYSAAATPSTCIRVKVGPTIIDRPRLLLPSVGLPLSHLHVHELPTALLLFEEPGTQTTGQQQVGHCSSSCSCRSSTNKGKSCSSSSNSNSSGTQKSCSRRWNSYDNEPNDITNNDIRLLHSNDRKYDSCCCSTSTKIGGDAQREREESGIRALGVSHAERPLPKSSHCYGNKMSPALRESAVCCCCNSSSPHSFNSISVTPDGQCLWCACTCGSLVRVLIFDGSCWTPVFLRCPGLPSSCTTTTPPTSLNLWQRAQPQQQKELQQQQRLQHQRQQQQQDHHHQQPRQQVLPQQPQQHLVPQRIFNKEISEQPGYECLLPDKQSMQQYEGIQEEGLLRNSMQHRQICEAGAGGQIHHSAAAAVGMPDATVASVGVHDGTLAAGTAAVPYGDIIALVLSSSIPVNLRCVSDIMSLYFGDEYDYTLCERDPAYYSGRGDAAPPGPAGASQQSFGRSVTAGEALKRNENQEKGKQREGHDEEETGLKEVGLPSTPRNYATTAACSKTVSTSLSRSPPHSNVTWTAVGYLLVCGADGQSTAYLLEGLKGTLCRVVSSEVADKYHRQWRLRLLCPSFCCYVPFPPSERVLRLLLPLPRCQYPVQHHRRATAALRADTEARTTILSGHKQYQQQEQQEMHDGLQVQQHQPKQKQQQHMVEGSSFVSSNGKGGGAAATAASHKGEITAANNTAVCPWVARVVVSEEPLRTLRQSAVYTPGFSAQTGNSPSSSSNSRGEDSRQTTILAVAPSASGSFLYVLTRQGQLFLDVAVVQAGICAAENLLHAWTREFRQMHNAAALAAAQLTLFSQRNYLSSRAAIASCGGSSLLQQQQQQWHHPLTANTYKEQQQPPPGVPQQLDFPVQQPQACSPQPTQHQQQSGLPGQHARHDFPMQDELTWAGQQQKQQAPHQQLCMSLNDRRRGIVGAAVSNSSLSQEDKIATQAAQIPPPSLLPIGNVAAGVHSATDASGVVGEAPLAVALHGLSTAAAGATAAHGGSDVGAQRDIPLFDSHVSDTCGGMSTPRDGAAASSDPLSCVANAAAALAAVACLSCVAFHPVVEPVLLLRGSLAGSVAHRRNASDLLPALKGLLSWILCDDTDYNITSCGKPYSWSQRHTSGDTYDNINRIETAEVTGSAAAATPARVPPLDGCGTDALAGAPLSARSSIEKETAHSTTTRNGEADEDAAGLYRAPPFTDVDSWSAKPRASRSARRGAPSSVYAHTCNVEIVESRRQQHQQHQLLQQEQGDHFSHAAYKGMQHVETKIFGTFLSSLRRERSITRALQRLLILDRNGHSKRTACQPHLHGAYPLPCALGESFVHTVLAQLLKNNPFAAHASRGCCVHLLPSVSPAVVATGAFLLDDKVTGVEAPASTLRCAFDTGLACSVSSSNAITRPIINDCRSCHTPRLPSPTRLLTSTRSPTATGRAPDSGWALGHICEQHPGEQDLTAVLLLLLLFYDEAADDCFTLQRLLLLAQEGAADCEAIEVFGKIRYSRVTSSSSINSSCSQHLLLQGFWQSISSCIKLLQLQHLFALCALVAQEEFISSSVSTSASLAEFVTYPGSNSAAPDTRIRGAISADVPKRKSTAKPSDCSLLVPPGARAAETLLQAIDGTQCSLPGASRAGCPLRQQLYEAQCRKYRRALLGAHLVDVNRLRSALRISAARSSCSRSVQAAPAAVSRSVLAPQGKSVTVPFKSQAFHDTVAGVHLQRMESKQKDEDRKLTPSSRGNGGGTALSAAYMCLLCGSHFTQPHLTAEAKVAAAPLWCTPPLLQRTDTWGIRNAGVGLHRRVATNSHSMPYETVEAQLTATQRSRATATRKTHAVIGDGYPPLTVSCTCEEQNASGGERPSLTTPNGATADSRETDDLMHQLMGRCRHQQTSEEKLQGQATEGDANQPAQQEVRENRSQNTLQLTQEQAMPRKQGYPAHGRTLQQQLMSEGFLLAQDIQMRCARCRGDTRKVFPSGFLAS